MVKKIASNKKIIFFDGDGTLWYPKKTKWTKKPHLIYTHLAAKQHTNKLEFVGMLFGGKFLCLRNLKS